MQLLVSQMSEIVLSSDKVVAENIGWCQKKVGEGGNDGNAMSEARARAERASETEEKKASKMMRENYF